MVLILYVAAFVLFVLATVGVPDAPRFRLVAAGLACLTLTLFIGRL